MPRTEHKGPDGRPEFTNRLIEESSPYLLQHAHNPVSWYSWSPEAFERAKRENKPIFLSVGYSTCHWCHVMERESFEDEEIAAFLNQHFIAIKVDREERPDVDSVYMTAVNLLAGSGGWPMTVIMTPDKEPFFGGTYFPPRRGVRGSRTGLIDILTDMVARYRNDPGSVAARAQELSQQVERVSFLPPGPGVPSDKTIAIAVSKLATSFDRVDGGFTGAPKFPQPSRLVLLLRYARRTGDAGATAMVATTLDRMAAGGIYDHVGGGFHRYSTDAKWLVPHFEKMLYDNAQLATRLSRGLATHGRCVLPSRVEGDSRLRRSRDDVARRWFLLGDRRGQPDTRGARRRGLVLHVDSGRARTDPRRRRRGPGDGRLRRERTRELRRKKHPSPGEERREACQGDAHLCP